MLDPDNLKKVPSSIESEKALLGCIFLNPKRFGDVLEEVKAKDFFKTAYRNIFTAMLEIYSGNSVIDPLLVIENLKRYGKYEESGGEEAIYDILETTATAANMISFAKIVKEKSLLRKLGNAGTKIVEMAYNADEEPQSILDNAESLIFEISENNDKKGVLSLKEGIKEEMDRLNKVYKNKGGLTGISSGYPDFDRMTSGFNPSDLVILAARPAMGKTALALNMSLNVALKSQKTVLIFSLEMPHSQLTQRLVAINAGIEISKIRTGFVDDSDLAKIGKTYGALSNSPIFIADTPTANVLDIRTIARRLKTEKALDLIVIDYLQLIRGTNESRGSFNRQQEISEISRSLKGLARELNVPVIALSQLSRQVEQRPDKRPMLSDLRESGAIEQDADIVMFLYRDEYYEKDDPENKGITELIIGKQRNGSTGTVKLLFNGPLTKFDSYTDMIE